jgi:long-chain acyl-CoA synthetase
MEHLGFASMAEANPHGTAVIDAGGTAWTRGDLAASANQITRAMRSHGCQPGDTIAVLSNNCAEFVVVCLAAFQAGLYVVPINWHLTKAELSYILADSKPRILFVHEKLHWAARMALASARIDTVYITLAPVHGCVDLRTLAAPYSPDAVLDVMPGTTLLYTSATTGKPKGVVVPLEQAAVARQVSLKQSAVNAARIGAPPDSGSAHLCTSMLYHGVPLRAALRALDLGNPVVLMSRWNPREFLEDVEKHKIRTTFMVPSMFVSLLRLPSEQRDRKILQSLKLITHGGAPCPPEVKRKMIDWLGPIFTEMYGASEGFGTFATTEDWLRYPGTVGKPSQGGGVKILNDCREELPANSVGEIFLKSPLGERFQYRGDDAKTRAAYQGEYFTVGDLGYLNGDGYLFITDRRTDVVISGGVNIYTAEIESAVLAHPRVRDCAAIGVPDPVLGEAIALIIEAELEGDDQREFATEILRFLRRDLAIMKLPKKMAFTSRVLRDPAGKLHKRKLRDEYLQLTFETVSAWA